MKAKWFKFQGNKSPLIFKKIIWLAIVEIVSNAYSTIVQIVFSCIKIVSNSVSCITNSVKKCSVVLQIVSTSVQLYYK